jgi:putative restriction endonuclease
VVEDQDLRVRLAAFAWLRAEVDIHGDVLPRDLLAKGFQFDGVRVPLIGPQGIFKPAVITDVPLSITTTPHGPYPDKFETGKLRYAYRGTDPAHRDNRGLRMAMQQQIPLVYFYGLEPGQYLAVWPVYIVGDHPGQLYFDVQVDEERQVAPASDLASSVAEERSEIRREYITATVRRRLHQEAFRARVLQAYRTRCALCRLRHQELLDAAHITEDALPEGDPVVSNGLALCKLHHAAFDRHFLTVRSDYRIEVRQAILEETDGPMLLHGLKAMHNQPILLPHSEALRPDRERLEKRYEAFLHAG